MTPSKSNDYASTQDVLTALREVLDTLRTMLARIPVAQGPVSGDATAAATAGALELSGMLHAVPNTDRQYDAVVQSIFDGWSELQRQNAAKNDAALQQADAARRPTARPAIETVMPKS